MMIIWYYLILYILIQFWGDLVVRPNLPFFIPIKNAPLTSQWCTKQLY
jgi:hypothetical protein